MAVLTTTGQFEKRVFACLFFFSPNETTPLITANAKRKTLNPVAEERSYLVVCVVCWGQGVDEVWLGPGLGKLRSPKSFSA